MLRQRSECTRSDIALHEIVSGHAYALSYNFPNHFRCILHCLEGNVCRAWSSYHTADVQSVAMVCTEDFLSWATFLKSANHHISHITSFATFFIFRNQMQLESNKSSRRLGNPRESSWNASINQTWRKIVYKKKKKRWIKSLAYEAYISNELKARIAKCCIFFYSLTAPIFFY